MEDLDNLDDLLRLAGNSSSNSTSTSECSGDCGSEPSSNATSSLPSGVSCSCMYVKLAIESARERRWLNEATLVGTLSDTGPANT